MLKKTIIEATTLPDAWFQAVYAAATTGREFKIDKGSYAGQTRLELDWVDIHVTKPWLRCADGLPLIPEIPEGNTLPPPVTKDYVRDYVRYIMTAEKEPGESYTYGSRMTEAPLSVFPPHPLHTAALHLDKMAKMGVVRNARYLDQVRWVIDAYKTYGHRNNQMVLQVAQPSDLLLEDPPCLRHIDTRIQDGKLHFFPYFRSWDLWGGFPANLAGISILQEYMAAEIGVEQGEMICTSKGLHIYGYAKDLAMIRAGLNQ